MNHWNLIETDTHCSNNFVIFLFIPPIHSIYSDFCLLILIRLFTLYSFFFRAVSIPLSYACTFRLSLIWFWVFFHLLYCVCVSQQRTRFTKLIKSNRKVISVPPKTTRCLLYVCHSRWSAGSTTSQAPHCVNPTNPIHGQLYGKSVTRNLIISFREI
jgi:hypothetical protein